jgi:hypothetical protein
MASDIPKTVPAGDAGIMLAPRQSLQQTMPRQTFEEVVLPHLDAAFNDARWLTKCEADSKRESHRDMS